MNSAGSTKKLVLIVDDSMSCAETLGIALESLAGVEVRILSKPGAAMALLREAGEVAAVITDIHLHHATGFDFIRQLRAEPRFRLLPIVVISGDSDPGIAARAISGGAAAFFSKPYSPAAVRRKLEQLVCASGEQML